MVNFLVLKYDKNTDLHLFHVFFVWRCGFLFENKHLAFVVEMPFIKWCKYVPINALLTNLDSLFLMYTSSQG